MIKYFPFTLKIVLCEEGFYSSKIFYLLTYNINFKS